MKIRSILASCALAGAAALPALTGSAGAAATTSLTVVNGYQYSATNLLSATVCLDDQLVQPFGTTVINPTIDTTVGSHTLRLSPDNLPCSDTTASWIDTPVDLMAVPAQTLAIGWQAGTQAAHDEHLALRGQHRMRPCGQSRCGLPKHRNLRPGLGELRRDPH